MLFSCPVRFAVPFIHLSQFKLNLFVVYFTRNYAAHTKHYTYQDIEPNEWSNVFNIQYLWYELNALQCSWSSSPFQCTESYFYGLFLFYSFHRFFLSVCFEFSICRPFMCDGITFRTCFHLSNFLSLNIFLHFYYTFFFRVSLSFVYLIVCS